MTFQQLQYLLEVSRCGSVTKAAKKLYVSYPSISIAISNLEKELGFPLFHRTATGLIPTESGELVLQHANRICQSYAMLGKVRKENRHTLRINSGDYPPISKAFVRLWEENKDRDDLILEMYACGADVLFQKILDGEMELSLIMSMNYGQATLEKRLNKQNLQYEILKTIPVVICVNENHPLAAKEIIYPHDLKNHIAVYSSSKPVGKSDLFSKIIYNDPRKVLTVSSASARSQLIDNAEAYAIMVKPPKTAVLSPSDCYIPLVGVYYNLFAVTNPQFPLPEELPRFMQILREELEIAYPESDLKV